VIASALAVAILLNSGFYIPFPITGLPSVTLSLLILFYGLRFLYRGLRLPVAEVLGYLDLRGGRARLVEIEKWLGAEADSLPEVMRVLSDKNWAITQIEDLHEVETESRLDDNLIILQDSGLKELRRIQKDRQ